MTTTLAAIRDGLTALIEAATPRHAPADVRFRYLPERRWMLHEWTEKNAGSAALRKFDIRRVGQTIQPEVVAPDEIQRTEHLLIAIAYPRLVGVYGKNGLDDMEDTIRGDASQIHDIAMSPGSNWTVTAVVINEPARDSEGAVWIQTIEVTLIYCEDQTLTLG